MSFAARLALFFAVVATAPTIVGLIFNAPALWIVFGTIALICYWMAAEDPFH